MKKSNLVNIEKVISSFNSSHIWKFENYVLNNKNLSQEDKELFKEILKKAGDFQFWNYSDLTIGCSNSSDYIRNNYDLSEQVILKIVNALAYRWK